MLSKIKVSLLACLLALCAACESSGPKGALDKMADALDDNAPSAFLGVMDMQAYASNQIKNLTQSTGVLNSLNALGNAFGFGGVVEELLGNIVDMKASLEQEFERGVASGELMAKCRTSETPDCPWVPQSLRNAEIVEIGQDAAIAKVTTPARLTSWLALRRTNGKWQVVGQAVLESVARAYAEQAPQAPAAAPAPAPQKTPEKNGVKI